MKQFIQRARLHIFVIAFMIIAGEFVQAQTGVADHLENKASVKYLNLDQSMLWFSVSYDNPSGERFRVIVSDEVGNPLYEEFNTDKHFNKKFGLPPENIHKLVFSIKNAKGSCLEKSFRVQTHISEDAIVTSL